MRRLETVVLHHEPGSLGVFTRSLAENGINLQSLYIMKTDGDEVHIGYSTA
jgi:acetolactate synthase small subunit